VGRLLNATKLIYGSYIILESRIRIDTKTTQVETGKVVSSREVSGKLDDIFPLEKELAAGILEHFHLEVPDTLKIQETSSLNALKTYYEGIAFFDEGKVDKAVEMFQKARELDPLYLKPQRGLEAAYQFLKDFRRLRQQREIMGLYEKVDRLRARLASSTWKTYAQIMTEAYAKMSPEEVERFNRENAVYLICNTRVECTWHLMLTLMEIGLKYNEYFDDAKTQKRLCEEIFRIAEKARTIFKGDPFLSEVLYCQLFAVECLEDYGKLKDYAERFLLAYPDYRLIEAVEDMYERSLNKLKEQRLGQMQRWQSSQIVGRTGVVTLCFRDEQSKSPYVGTLRVTAADGKRHETERFHTKVDQPAEFCFPKDFRSLEPQSGQYAWEYVVEGKAVAKGKFDYKAFSSKDVVRNLKTRAGELTIESLETMGSEAEETVNYINLNGARIRRDDLNEYLSLEKLFPLKAADVVLLLEYTTCAYRFLTLKADGSHQISVSFGDCGDVPKMRQEGDKIVVQFPKNGETVVYENEQVAVTGERK
jgi:tetratricopeptide (TPR) repeat protein